VENNRRSVLNKMFDRLRATVVSRLSPTVIFYLTCSGDSSMKAL